MEDGASYLEKQIDATMYETLVCLHNQLKHREPDYQEHIRDISLFCLDNLLIERDNGHYTRNAYPKILEFESFNECLFKADELNVDWLFVASYGFRTHDNIIINKSIDYAKRNGYSILGHILDDTKGFPGGKFYQLHEQCVLINIKDWIKFDRPWWGNCPDEVWRKLLPNVERSIENFHDDYTPHWIKKAEGYPTYYEGHLSQSWNIIANTLYHNGQIGGFPEEIRQQKSFLYPDNGDILEKALKGQDVTPSDPNQYRYLKHQANPDTFADGVYVYNTDNIANTGYLKSKDPIDTLYCVSAGFKPLSIFKDIVRKSSTRVVYYDYSAPALRFRKWLVTTWDGRNFPDRMAYYVEHHDPDFTPLWFGGRELHDGWQEQLDYFGGADKFAELWNEYRQHEHKYIRCSLFEDCQELYDDMKTTTGRNVIWYSNSFLTDISLRLYRRRKLVEMYNNFVKECNDNSTAIELMGLQLHERT